MAEYKKLPDGTIVKVAGQGGIADNLTTLSPVMSLSAKQGNVLDINKAERTDISNIITTGTKNTTGAQIASGTYFYLNGQLVKAKSNIAVNDDYTLNTNYELATVGGVLTELNSKITYYSGTGTTDTAGKIDDIPLPNNVVAVAVYFRNNNGIGFIRKINNSSWGIKAVSQTDLSPLASTSINYTVSYYKL